MADNSIWDDVGGAPAAPPPTPTPTPLTSEMSVWDNVGGPTATSALDAPATSSATCDATGLVTVTWDPVVGATSYVVLAAPVSGVGVTKTVTSGTTSTSISGLTVGHLYSFQIQGVVGGLAGTAAVATCDVDVAPSVPSPLTAVIDATGNIRLSWAPPLNTTVTSYHYVATPTAASYIDAFTDDFGDPFYSDNATKSGTIRGNLTTYSIANPTPGQLYTITLTASSSLFTSAAATTTILAVSGGGTGTTTPGTTTTTTVNVVPVPIPGGGLPVQPVPSATSRTTTAVASNIAEAYILDLDNPTRTLWLLPHGGGIYTTTVDLGYPTTRDVVSNTPDAHGTIDLTTLYGARGITLDGACVDYADATGVQRSAQEWVNLLRSWCVLGSRMAFVYRLRGDVKRYMLIRPQQVVDPLVLGLGRSIREWQISFKVPDGLTYIYPDFPDPQDPVPIRERQQVPLSTASVGGFNLNNVTGINLASSTGVSFNGANVAAGWPMERAYLGTLPNQPIIRIWNFTGRGTSHVITSPVFTMTNSDGTTSSVDLSGLVAAAALSIPAGSHVEIDVAARTILLYDSTGASVNVRKYLNPAVALPWTTFQLTTKSASFKLTVADTLTTAQQANVYAELSYRTAFI